MGCGVRQINAPGGMRGGPGGSRFELKLSLHSSHTVAPEGVAGFNRFAHSAWPGLKHNMCPQKAAKAPRARKWTPVAAKKRPETPKVSPEDLQNGTIVGLIGPKWFPRWSQRGTSGTCWIGILFSAKFFVRSSRF